MKTHDYNFKAAVPVWEVGTQKTMNRTISAVAKLNKHDSCKLAAAGSSSFVILVNGQVIAHGPARAAHGFYRVDEYELAPYLTADDNVLEIRVAGYNINTFQYLDQPSFICAEVICDNVAVAYTSSDKGGFVFYGIDERIMKVHRYSYQRVFVENYRLDSSFFNYSAKVPVQVEQTDSKSFICRDMPYGDYDRIFPVSVIGRGSISYSDKKEYHRDRSITQISNRFRGYLESELEFASYVEIGKMDFSEKTEKIENADSIELSADTYADVDMGKNYTGLFELELEAATDGEFFITFDEILQNGQVNCFRIEPTNILGFTVKKGKYKIVSAEPYVMRYIRLSSKGGTFKINGLKLIEIAFPKTAITAKFVSEDSVMEKIYDAAVLTFRANTVDIYMDCPSRERAGWLCDSFFTARVEYALTGRSDIEKQFLSNFIMPSTLPHMPRGMLPMCYPSDHDQEPSFKFIPNWAMFYGIELKEYFDRTGDSELINAARDRMYELCEYFNKFENEYGLLEDLESWVFVEWSKANELLKNVSFATNMLYCLFLRSISALYSDGAMERKADALKKTINDMSMTESGFFCDNAVRQNGKLVISGERTEACQYYAFFCGIATPKTHEQLWTTLVNDFGYDRQKTGKFPEIYPANAFIGNYLRLDLLDRYGYRDALYDNIKGYFEYMADRTGTLWELVSDNASCNHGFASHVIWWMRSLDLIK